ncbi:MAG: squalene/phytoene synthase family protein [Verrucomicrobia bacterium]|nr:squalene/phytoene synthase family protein [Verrucomicrobiota bacterium]
MRASTAPPDLDWTRLLREVSRSFYLTLRVLPSRVRIPIGLAYLLARATDTVADTEAIPAEFRLAALDQLRKAILSGGFSPDFSRFLDGLPPGHPGNPTAGERALLAEMPRTLQWLGSMDPADRERIRQVLEVITSGQILDVGRFGQATEKSIVALKTLSELDDYTYRVAGCVGEFWTRICRTHLFPDAPISESALLEDGVRFGKGLQLVNILRDLPKDLRLGRCYLPSEQLMARSLVPGDLLDPAAYERLAPLFGAALDRARGHLDAGWRYTNSLPRRLVRIRLACAWPILIGIDTLGRLRGVNPLEGSHRVKTPRAVVRGMIWQSVWRLAWPPAWNRLDRWAEARVKRSRESPFSKPPKQGME